MYSSITLCNITVYYLTTYYSIHKSNKNMLKSSNNIHTYHVSRKAAAGFLLVYKIHIFSKPISYMYTMHKFITK